jgi:hypothetical protein
MGVKTFVLAQWDRVFAWVAIALGLLVLLIGWLGVSDTAFVFEQLPYVVSGGIGGLFLLGVGAMMWLSADLRDEWRKLDALEVALWETARQQEAAPELDELTELPLPEQTAPVAPRRSRAALRKS